MALYGLVHSVCLCLALSREERKTRSTRTCIYTRGVVMGEVSEKRLEARASACLRFFLSEEERKRLEMLIYMFEGRDGCDGCDGVFL